MKSRRKIWSIPIALVMVLALAAMVGLYGIVQAQSSGDRIISVDGTDLEGNEYTEYVAASAITDAVTGITDGDADGGTVVIAAVDIPDNEGTDDDDTPKDETSDGLNTTADPQATPPTTVEAVVGYSLSGADAGYFFINQSDGQVRVKDATSLAYIQNVANKGVFNFDVNIYVDTDTATDGADADENDVPNNDKDEVNTLAVTLHALKLDTATFNYAATINDVADTPLMGLTSEGAGYSKGIGVVGAPSAAVVTAAIGTGSGEVVTEVDDVDVTWIKHVVDGTTGAIELADNENTIVDITGTVTVDPDGVPATGEPANEAGIPLAFEGSVKVFDELLYNAAVADNPNTVLADDPDYDAPHEFSVQSNADMGTVIGEVGLAGAFPNLSPGDADTLDESEVIDIIVTGTSAFSARARVNGTNNEAEAAVIMVATDGLSAGMHEFSITANGRLSSTRTVAANVKVSVTASNPEPESAYDADNPLVLEGFESDMGAANLIADDADLDVDFGDYVSDDTADSGLTYSISDERAFELDGSKLVPVGDILASTLKGGTGEDEDDAATTTVDETVPVYERDDGGVLTDTSDEYSDITYEFDITISDAANTITIPVELTLVVNDPVSVSAETVADGEYVSTDPFGGLIVDVGALINNGEETGDEVTYGWSVSDIAPFQINEDGEIKITFPGRTYATDQVWIATVTINDDFENSSEVLNDAVDPAASFDPKRYEDDATVVVTITAVEGDPPEREHVEVTIMENHTLGSEVANLKTHADLAGKFPGAEDYSVVGGDGEDKFSILDEATGVVTLNSDADIDVDGVDANGDPKDSSYLLSVSVTGANNVDLGEISLVIDIMGVNENPVFAEASSARGVDENAQSGSDVGAVIVATDPDGDDISFSVKSVTTKHGTAAAGTPFRVITATDANDDEINGHAQVQVNGDIDIDDEPYAVVITATDDGSPSKSTDHTVTVTLGDINDAPVFDSPVTLHVPLAENATADTHVATYNATDPDGPDIIQGVEFILRNADDVANFTITNHTDDATGEISGVLTVAEGADLEYDIDQDSPAPVTYTVEVNVCDESETGRACNEIALIVTLSNSNDEIPIIGNDDESQDIPENSARGSSLGDYSAADKDNLNDPGFDTITYTLGGDHGKYFQISDTGELMTLASLDYDRINEDGSRGVPCVSCDVIVVATDSDSPGKSDSQGVTISVTPVEDSVSTVKVTKANPVPGTSMGNKHSALFGTKMTMYGQTAVEERPSNLPATVDPAPDAMNYVATEWANWGTVLRIAVTAESPDEKCEGGNQCVVINLNSDSADDSLKLKAFRSADQENKFVAAVVLVEESKDVTPGEAAVYMHPGGGVPALRVDEEDEIEIEFGNLRGDIDVENEAPEISNFAPEHEAAFDDADVDYTFTVTDSHSGLPEPEDLPDNDGDDNYTPAVALISEGQCETVADSKTVVSKLLKVVAHINEDETLYCPGTPSDGEYVATEASSDFGFAPIRDDKDFDEIDDGFDVETTIVLAENKTYFVTFIVCDNAGNCTFYDPDGNEDKKELAQITVDTEEPEFVEARTGLTWDSTDNEYDDNRAFLQVIFNDLTQLNSETVEIDDFVVEGHTIKDVHIFENPDDDDVDWADSGRYGADGSDNLRDIPRYRDIENSVFVELEDELLADETPDVTIVPNGVEDQAGNEQDDGDHEADDWISPKFTIVSIVSTRETSQDEILAGDDDEVTVVVTADERLDQTRPTVTVTYVKAPAGSVDTKGVAACKTSDDKDGTRSRGEIVLKSSDTCGGSDAAGGTLNNSVEKVSNTEWIVTITEPEATGYYNFRIEGKDRSSQENPGSEGIAASSIVTDFFDSDGDVNADDAVFFEGDINLAKPNVRVSGMMITDNEPSVEYRSPLFVEIDFTRNHMRSSDCGSGKDRDHLMANCENENSEYAEDNFDDIVVTMFELDGVDMTDSVKTTDDQTFLVTLESVALGDHTAKIQAMDVAGNILEDILEIDFEVSDRDPFDKRLSPGWNLVSLPGEPADSSIASVFGPGVEVRTVYTYDPVIPGGWMVAVRETLDSDWQGDLTEITGMRGYWVLSDAIQDWEVSIPRLAGGAAGTGTPIQPPVIPLYAGWNLIPVTDVKGNALSAGVAVSAETYLQSLESGVEPARVLGFDTIRNEWYTVLDGDMTGPGMGTNLEIGSAYWVFVREATSLVPGGAVGGGSGD